MVWGDLLRRRAGRGSEDVHECRRCGTTLEPAADDCPACGSDSIASYEIR